MARDSLKAEALCAGTRLNARRARRITFVEAISACHASLLIASYIYLQFVGIKGTPRLCNARVRRTLKGAERLGGGHGHAHV